MSAGTDRHRTTCAAPVMPTLELVERWRQPLAIGGLSLANRCFVAPMAGVTDRPFRQLCKRLGAGYAVSEMISANPQLRHTRKSLLRADHRGEIEPIAVQIAGAEPDMLAAAARENVARGAQIIDINMGCPAKKVCNKMAGSALLADEPLVARILDAVVAAVDVPVTLKIRTGPDPEHRNGVTIAQLAEAAGISALAVHGRTRADKYQGLAEYDTIRAIRQAVGLPLIANGDIDSPQKAAAVMEYTGADAVMIGRAAQGNPWIFRQIDQYLRHGRLLTSPAASEVGEVLLGHLRTLHRFYGPVQGVRVARKHIGWYLSQLDTRRDAAMTLRRTLMREEDAARQCLLIEQWFSSEWLRAA